jgi:hypothetical protein
MSLLKTGRPSSNVDRALKQLDNAQDVMKMNINITKSFHKEVKYYALKHDITITELIKRSLQEYMSK